MNKTKIEWTDYTWNPITGCKNGCWYCYANKLFTRFHKSFEPTFHPERLYEPLLLDKPCKIFCCSVSDLFAKWTKESWRKQVLDIIEKDTQAELGHTFQLLTKHPEGIDKNFEFSQNVWVGATVTQKSEIKNFDEIKRVKAKVRFVSFEPLLEDISFDLENNLKDRVEWVIIGKLTGSKRIEIQIEWVQRILDITSELRIPTFIKNNVNWKEKIQKFPIVVNSPQSQKRHQEAF
jgi:protein gp37